MTNSIAIRSALYMPGNKERVLDKAAGLSCDRVIVDLEDAVSPDAKPDARDLAVKYIGGGRLAPDRTMLRINGLDTPWSRDDLAAVGKSGVGAVLVPKVSSVAILAQVRQAVPDGTAIWAMVETCQGVLDIAAIARGGRELGLTGFIIGPNDLAKEMRCRPGTDRAPLIPALSQTVMAARANGLIVLDGVYNDFRDSEGLRAECAQGVALGFDGKSLIHPDQIAIANHAFSPGEEEVAQARAIVEAFALPENAGKGVITVNGRMTELLHLDQARQLLALAGLDRAEGSEA